MQTEVTQNEPRSILADLAEARKEIRSQASGKKDESVEELSPGNDPVEELSAKETIPADSEPVAEETEVAKEPEKVIKIGDKVFKTESEAIAYAEKLEHDILLQEAYNQGIRETLQATQAPKVPEPIVEENFEEKFYADPKKALLDVKESAKREALEIVKQEQAKESLWRQFLDENPDIERRDAERVLQENWDTIGKMTDYGKAMKLLATKTRSEYQRIAEKFKVKVELPPAKAAQVVSSGSSSRPNVTNVKKDDAPLTMAQQMKNLRARR